MFQSVWTTHGNSHCQRAQYVGKPYNDLCSKWNIKHTTTSPRYAKSNGLVERQVQTVKGIIQKCSKTGNDIQIKMQHLRCIPIDTDLPSPSEIMFNCPDRTHLSSYHPTLVYQKRTDINDRLQVRRGSMIQYHGRNAGPEFAPLHAGQRVRLLNKDTHTRGVRKKL